MKKNIPAIPTRRRWVGIALILVAVLAAAGGTIAVITGTADADRTRATDIPRYVPADADTVVVAPYGGTWWTKVAAMAPQELMVQPLQPDQGLSIQNIGYSRSPDTSPREITGAGPLRIFYIEAPGDDEAAAVKTWLDHAPGYDHRNVVQHGHVLAVTSVWVANYPSPAQTIADVKAFSTDVTDSQGSMWFNPEGEAASLTGGSGTDGARLLGTMLEKGFGFKNGTAWSGTSKDGNAWEGTFASGGVDASQIDFSQASSALMEKRRVLLSAKSPATTNAQSGFQVTDPGLSAVLTAASVKVAGKEGSLGVSALPASVKPVPGVSMSAVVDVTAWNRAATGDLATTENVLTRSMSANGNQMNLSLTYAPEK